jgi:hypothetical protein
VDINRSRPARPVAPEGRTVREHGGTATGGTGTAGAPTPGGGGTQGEGARVFHSGDELGSTIAASCDMCHPDAANTHPETYPKLQVQLGRVALLRDMINWCLQHPVRTPAMSADDPRVRAMEAYILAQRQGTPLSYGKHQAGSFTAGHPAPPPQGFPCRGKGLVTGASLLLGTGRLPSQAAVLRVCDGQADRHFRG